jgi:hypothetical protein
LLYEKIIRKLFTYHQLLVYKFIPNFFNIFLKKELLR